MVQLTDAVEHDSSAPRAPTVRRGAPSARAVVAAVLLVGSATTITARWLTPNGYQPALFGLPDPGEVTAIGLPVAQYVHDMAGVAVVGLLFLSCVAIRGSAEPARRHIAQMAERWAWVWVVSTLVWIVFTVSDLASVPVSGLASQGDIVVLLVGSNRVLAEIATLWVALAIAMFGARLSGTFYTGAVSLLAVAALLPSALTGHASHHSSPLIASVALGVHVVAAALWVGALLALVVHLRPYPEQLRVAVPRFSLAALLCVIAIGTSGVVESVVTLASWSALWDSNRGHLIIAKTVALVVLAGFGYLHRRRTVDAASSGRLLPLLKLASSELVLMGVTIGLAVALSTTA